jgi:hypothetical protein
MNKFLLQVALVFFFAIVLIFIHGYSGHKIEIFSIELKKAPVEIVSADIPFPHITRVIYQDSSQNDTETGLNSDRAITLDSNKQRILLIGDSMTEILVKALSNYCEENHHNLKSVVWVSSSISGWNKSQRLKNFVNEYNPTFVMIVLGSNELFTPNSPAREKNIKELISQADPADIVWIGPPNWKPDKGLYDQLVDVLGSDRVFESKNLTFKRQKDGIHPTFESSGYWTDAISEWIMDKSRHKIILNKPSLSYFSKPDIRYFKN